MREVQAYLYDGQKIISDPVTGTFGTFVIVDTGDSDAYRCEYVRDRLQSGMFGATLFDSPLEDVEAYIEAEKD
jgi:hypothetical protein